MKYKIWVEIEECDEETDAETRNVGEPMSVGVFDTYEAAAALQDEICGSYDDLAPALAACDNDCEDCERAACVDSGIDGVE